MKVVLSGWTEQGGHTVPFISWLSKESSDILGDITSGQTSIPDFTVENNFRTSQDDTELGLNKRLRVKTEWFPEGK